jgi:O-antigen ligase
VQALLFLLLIVGLVLPQILMGGAKLLFSAPGYVAIGLACVLPLFLSFRRARPGIRWAPFLAALLFAGYVIARSYASPYAYAAKQDRLLAMAAFGVYALTALYLPGQKYRFGIIYVLIGVASLQVACGILQFFWKPDFMLLSWLPDGFLLPKIFRPTSGYRASGFYGSPNHLAGMLETLGLVCLAMAVLGRWKAIPRTLLIYATLTCLTGVALTASRGGYVSTVAGFFVFLGLFAWAVKKLRPKRFLALVMAGLLLGSAMLGGVLWAMSKSDFLTDRMGQVADTKDIRRSMWDAALKQFQISPVWGTGSGTYQFYGRELWDQSNQLDPVHAHSDYLEFLGEYGVVGSLFALAFLVLHGRAAGVILLRIIRVRLRPAKRLFSNELALLAGVLAALVALLVHSALDFNCHLPANALLYAFFFGILASPSSDPKLVHATLPAPMRLGRLALPALGTTLLVVCVTLLPGEYHDEWARVQLRSRRFTRLVADLQTTLANGLPTASTGCFAPRCALPVSWTGKIDIERLLPEARRHAELGLQWEQDNPNLYYRLGEARYLAAMFEPDADRRQDAQISALEGYVKGLALVPRDVDLLVAAGRTSGTLGEFDLAEKYFVQAMQLTPRLGSVYAQYGDLLFQQRHLVRAEGYYRLAGSFDGRNESVLQGRGDIARLRNLAQDAAYVEEFGNPLEAFDLDPPTDEDLARGVVVDE